MVWSVIKAKVSGKGAVAAYLFPVSPLSPLHQAKGKMRSRRIKENPGN